MKRIGLKSRILASLRQPSFFVGFRQDVNSLVLPVTLLAAEVELSPVYGNGEGLAFGDIALADRILDQDLARLGVRNLPAGGGEGAPDHPIDTR